MQGLRARTAAAASAGAGAGPPPNPRDRHRPCAVGPRAAPPPPPPFPAWRLLPPASGGGLRGRRDGGRGWGCPFGAAAQPVWVSGSSASPCLPELRVPPVGFRRWAAPPASDWDLQLSCQEAKLFKVMHAVSRLCEHCIKACSKPTTILLIALTGYICSTVTIPHTTSRR